MHFHCLFIFRVFPPHAREAHNPVSMRRHANKRLELTLNKFTNIALPFHLDIVNQHRVNIESVRAKTDRGTGMGKAIIFFLDGSMNADHNVWFNSYIVIWRHDDITAMPLERITSMKHLLRFSCMRKASYKMFHWRSICVK